MKWKAFSFYSKLWFTALNWSCLVGSGSVSLFTEHAMKDLVSFADPDWGAPENPTNNYTMVLKLFIMNLTSYFGNRNTYGVGPTALAVFAPHSFHCSCSARLEMFFREIIFVLVQAKIPRISFDLASG
ncbi:hypothetical protein DFH27DRAFT_170084 [Peziza echinospora]|nr:hypothetical protein DFH27DRAFT_170084 [Peziza echinospora]